MTVGFAAALLWHSHGSLADLSVDKEHFPEVTLEASGCL